MQPVLYDEMFRMEEKHWWFAAKRRIVLALLETYLPRLERPARICDIGCGCGMMLTELARQGYQAVGVDADEKALAYCQQRGATAIRGFLPGGLPAAEPPFDAVLMLDVLEHVEEDAASLRAAASLLGSGGVLICTVPAHRWLWSPRDEAHQHLRRYDRKGFVALLASAQGCRVAVESYFNSFLFPAAVGARLASRVLPQREGGDLRVLPLGINSALREIFACERHFLRRGIRLPQGLSLLAVLRKE